MEGNIKRSTSHGRRHKSIHYVSRYRTILDVAGSMSKQSYSLQVSLSFLLLIFSMKRNIILANQNMSL